MTDKPLPQQDAVYLPEKPTQQWVKCYMSVGRFREDLAKMQKDGWAMQSITQIDSKSAGRGLFDQGCIVGIYIR